MKATDTFKTVINAHLLSVAENDSLFAETLKKPNKNLDDCITYIFNEVKKSGCNGFADEEIFGMAIHYYDEDDIKPGAKVSGSVVVNHHIDAPPPPKEKKAAKKAAPVEPAKVVTDQKEKISFKAAKKKAMQTYQSTLFD